MIHMYSGGQTGLITKNQLRSPAEALSSGSFVASLDSALVVVASVATVARGHLEITKNCGRSGLEKSSIPYGTSG